MVACTIGTSTSLLIEHGARVNQRTILAVRRCWYAMKQSRRVNSSVAYNTRGVGELTGRAGDHRSDARDRRRQIGSDHALWRGSEEEGDRIEAAIHIADQSAARCNADPKLRNKAGHNAFDIAKYSHEPEVVAMITAKLRGNVGARNSFTLRR